MTVKTCGHEKIHYTVVLACYGRILTPFLIFKRKKHYIKKEYLMVFYVPVCPKDWMNEGEMKLWLDTVYCWWDIKETCLIHLELFSG